MQNLSKYLLRLAVPILMAGSARAAVPVSEDADTLRGVVLKEITVGRTRERYSKKNNPAVDFARRLRAMRDESDPERHPNYSYRKYEKFALGLSDFHMPDTIDANGRLRKPGRFDFLREHVDTSDVTGLPVLPLTVKEKVSDVYFRREPRSDKEVVMAVDRHGIDEVADLSNVQTVVEDVFREVDLFDDDIPLLRNRFVSPLSPVAPDFYKFYLTDTVNIDGASCVVLSFAPRNPATFGFLGRVYVEKGDNPGDTAMFVRRIAMGVSPTINLNFVDRLNILQEFQRAPDGTRLKTKDDMNVELRIADALQGFYARRTTLYDRHSFMPPEDSALFDRLGDVFVDPSAYARVPEYWAEWRPATDESSAERRIPELMERLRTVPLYRYGEKFVRLMVQGYVTTGKPSKFDIGPLNTFISGNTVEGARFRLGGMTTANLSPHWFARGYAAYGIRDHRWKYSAELEYSFNRKKYHSREFPVHSIMALHRYDIDQLGQHYLFTNADNVFLAWKRQRNTLITYLRQSSLTYRLELANHLSFMVEAALKRQEAGPFVPFMLTDGTGLGHFTMAAFTATIRYAPGEKFYQMKSGRSAINHDNPVITLSHTYSPAGWLGCRFGSNLTEISVQKRFWFSAFGYADVMLKGGHQWGRAPFTSLSSPNANLSYTIQPESFALLNPLEFINDSYVSWDLTYWANGAILNYIPLVKRLKLREVVAFRGWWGRLSRHNDPRLPQADGEPPMLLFPAEAAATPMGRTPYMEISAGIDNLFKVLRVDYVWRLTYRHPAFQPLPVSRSGVRIALHVTF